MNNSYYWGNPDTSVTFCEEKYHSSPFIAEYYNTMTALSYLIVGVFFIFISNLRKFGLIIIALGIGTIILHSTLRFYGQWLDEASMLLLSFESIIHLQRQIPRYLFPILLGFYTYYRNTFMIFGILFAVMQLVIIYIAYNKLELKNYYRRILLKLYTICFIIAFIFWLLDQFFCEYMGNLNGHAIWHVGTALGLLFGLMALI